MKRILVCGSRDFKDFTAIYDELSQHEITHLICGDCEGTDSLAVKYTKQARVSYSVYYAQWKKHDLAAGPIRNKQMLDEGKPDLVVAFKNKQFSKGTDDMIKQAKAAGVEVKIIMKE